MNSRPAVAGASAAGAGDRIRALSAERPENGADLLRRAPVVVELGDDRQVLAQLDERHPGSPVIVQAGQLRVDVEEPLRLRGVR